MSANNRNVGRIIITIAYSCLVYVKLFGIKCVTNGHHTLKVL